MGLAAQSETTTALTRPILISTVQPSAAWGSPTRRSPWRWAGRATCWVIPNWLKKPLAFSVRADCPLGHPPSS